MILNTELNWTMKVDSRNYAESVPRTFVGMDSKNWPGYFNCSPFQVKVSCVVDSRIIPVSITFTAGSNWVEDKLEGILWKVWGVETRIFWGCKKQNQYVLEKHAVNNLWIFCMFVYDIWNSFSTQFKPAVVWSRFLPWPLTRILVGLSLLSL